MHYEQIPLGVPLYAVGGVPNKKRVVKIIFTTLFYNFYYILSNTFFLTLLYMKKHISAPTTSAVTIEYHT